MYAEIMIQGLVLFSRKCIDREDCLINTDVKCKVNTFNSGWVFLQEVFLTDNRETLRNNEFRKITTWHTST